MGGLRAFWLALLIGSLLGPANASADPPARDGRLTGPDGQPIFVIGASYQGPAELSWRGEYWAGWADDRFDPALVAADFQRASGAGLNTLRIFVQRELLHDIRKDGWWKLDAVVDLAAQSGLRLIVTFGDYDERRVSDVARVSSSIARRYAGHPAILAYELRNEPTFWTLQSARYPDGQRPPLLSSALVEAYGERAARHYINAFRLTDEGQRGPLAIPERFSEDEAYYYHNNWLLSYELAHEASAWAQARGRTDLEYFSSPEAARWATFLEALNATYDAWLEPQVRLLREADPTKPITVGHNDPLLEALPANRRLDFLSHHRYPPPGLGGLTDHRRSLSALRAIFPGKPILLGEFGHRTAELGEAQAAVEETAIFLQLLADSFAGGVKWMLTDTREATDSMGIFRMDGSPKPLAYATAGLARYLAGGGGPGSLELSQNEGGGPCYLFRADAALLIGGGCGQPSEARLLGQGPNQLFVNWAQARAVQLSATAPAGVELRLASLVGGGGARGWALESDDPAESAKLSERGGVVTFQARPGQVYRLSR